MGIRSFLGIIPPRITYSTETAPVEGTALAEEITILRSWPGPDSLNVKVGSRVNTGQNLIENCRIPFVSTATGVVSRIEKQPWMDGADYLAVTIRTESKETIDGSFKKIDDIESLDSKEILAAIIRAGIPGFESVVKGIGIKAIVISALDKSPLCTSNQQVFRDSPAEVTEGAKILMRAKGVNQITLAVPDNLISSVSVVSGGDIRIVKVAGVFPNGLPDALARNQGGGRLLRKGRNGVTGDTLVISAEHVSAIAGCLKSGQPYNEKVVTCIGKDRKSQKNIRVRIGTPISEVMKSHDMAVTAGCKLIVNGPMCGYACYSDDQPITPESDSVMIQEPSEIYEYEDFSCINCGKCNAICPVDLEVNMLGRFSEYGIFDKCKKLGVENCIECGLCAYVCPAHRPMVQFLIHAKNVIETEPPADMSMKEALACNICGPSCHAIRLFDEFADMARPENDEETAQK
jgi:H+/Na+-translocating ferredoxin:NAD+ oxidoreductase subunit C